MISLQIILLIFTYFTQWFIYTFMHDDASMARGDKRSWQKNILIWSVSEYKKIHISLPLARSGLTAEYHATRTNFFVAGYAVRRNLVIHVEVCNLFWNRSICGILCFILATWNAVTQEQPRTILPPARPAGIKRMWVCLSPLLALWYISHTEYRIVSH